MWLFHIEFELDANEAKADGDNADADEAIEADADETDEADKANEANEAKEANEYDNADKADEVNEATALAKAIDAGFISFSLTKCSTIFVEVKEYFEAKNNQHELGFNVQIWLMCRSNSSVQNWW